jgi:hypothetical protein
MKVKQNPNKNKKSIKKKGPNKLSKMISNPQKKKNVSMLFAKCCSESSNLKPALPLNFIWQDDGIEYDFTVFEIL